MLLIEAKSRVSERGWTGALSPP